MTVKTDRTGEETDRHSRVLLGGRPGSGLSRSAAGWPSPYFVLFGGDLRYAGDGLSFTEVTSVDDLMSVLAALNGQDLGAPVSTAVFDTLDGLDRLLGEDPKKLRALLRAIGALPLDVVLLCHVDSADDRLSLASCIGDEVTSFVDCALHLEVSRPTQLVGRGRPGQLLRYAQAWPDSRVPWVMDRTGNLPEYVHLSELSAVVADVLAAGEEKDVTANRVQSPAPPAPPAPTPAPAPAARKAPARAPLVAPAPEAVEPEDEDGEEPGVDEEDDDDQGGFPLCSSQGAQGNDCLGRVESQDSLDLSMVRFEPRNTRPMCGPCMAAELDAIPKVIPRKARPAPVGPSSTGPGSAGPPQGERVGRVRPTDDQALRDLLGS